MLKDICIYVLLILYQYSEILKDEILFWGRIGFLITSDGCSRTALSDAGGQTCGTGVKQGLPAPKASALTLLLPPASITFLKLPELVLNRHI